MSARNTPEINAGSMADIAFLLLIFFLVVTTISADKGIQRKLPDYKAEPPKAEVPQRNILTVLINGNNQLLVEDKYVYLQDLQAIVIDFVDNNGDESCDYCKGERLETSSDNPTKAVVSVTSDRATKYASYVAVQNELAAAYTFLRNRLSQDLYGQDYKDLAKSHQIQKIKMAYPLIISEAETNVLGN